MADFYLAVVEPKKEITPDQVKTKMDLAIDWFRITPNIWILYSSSDTDKWYARLKPLTYPEGSVFICRLDVKEHNGWMTKMFWEWLNKDRS